MRAAARPLRDRENVLLFLGMQYLITSAHAAVVITTSGSVT
jgi:hypothetical protein